MMAVTVYVPSLGRAVSAIRTWSPTARSPTAIVAPPLVIFVSAVTAIVRVQPSSVLSETFEPSIGGDRDAPEAEAAEPAKPVRLAGAPRSPERAAHRAGGPRSVVAGPVPTRRAGRTRPAPGVACGRAPWPGPETRPSRQRPRPRRGAQSRPRSRPGPPSSGPSDAADRLAEGDPVRPRPADTGRATGSPVGVGGRPSCRSVSVWWPPQSSGPPSGRSPGPVVPSIAQDDPILRVL